jgi:hypothetical protein
VYPAGAAVDVGVPRRLVLVALVDIALDAPTEAEVELPATVALIIDGVLGAAVLERVDVSAPGDIVDASTSVEVTVCGPSENDVEP